MDRFLRSHIARRCAMTTIALLLVAVTLHVYRLYHSPPVRHETAWQPPKLLDAPAPLRIEHAVYTDENEQWEQGPQLFAPGNESTLQHSGVANAGSDAGWKQETTSTVVPPPGYQARIAEDRDSLGGRLKSSGTTYPLSQSDRHPVLIVPEPAASADVPMVFPRSDESFGPLNDIARDDSRHSTSSDVYRIRRLPPIPDETSHGPFPRRDEGGSPRLVAEPQLAAPLPLPTPMLPTPTLPPTGETMADRREMAIISERAGVNVRHGLEAAQRGAIYTARSEFIQALRLIADTLDARQGSPAHSTALSRGLRTLKEVKDFMPHGTRLEADIDMPGVVAGHRTPVLKADLLDDDYSDVLTPRVAMDRYYKYAHQQLALAAGELPIGSFALYSLGKLHSLLATQRSVDRRLEEFRAMALFQAALSVDANNPLAANELGVMMARYGRYEPARELLERSLANWPQPTVLRSLAIVYQRLGDSQSAERASQQAMAATHKSGTLSARSPVRWLSNEEFLSSQRATHQSLPTNPTVAPKVEPDTPSTASPTRWWRRHN